MVSHDGSGELTDTERREFVSRLRELKQKGASLLVVGNVSDATAAQGCHWMLGDTESTDRRRLFVSTSGTLPSITNRLSTPLEQLRPDTTTLVTWTAESRNTATASPPQPPNSTITPVHVESEQLSELGITISREIKAFEDIAGELVPSELRICFDSLSALFAEYDSDEIFRFLHVLIGRIRSVRAMGHFHLPVDRDSELVQQIAPLFDATIELRSVDGRVQQRWHLRDGDITSNWLTLSPAPSG